MAVIKAIVIIGIVAWAAVGVWIACGLIQYYALSIGGTVLIP